VPLNHPWNAPGKAGGYISSSSPPAFAILIFFLAESPPWIFKRWGSFFHHDCLFFQSDNSGGVDCFLGFFFIRYAP